MTMTSLVLIFFVGQLQGLAFKSDEDPSLFEFGERSFQKMDEIVDDEELKKQSDSAIIGYKIIGCFKSKHHDRPLPVHYANLGNLTDFNNYRAAVEECAKRARRKGYEYFIVHFYGECWGMSGLNPAYANSTNCLTGVGLLWTNYVFKFT